MDIAANHLEASLQPRKGHRWRAVVGFILDMVGLDTLAVLDLVVVRKDTRAEVMRTPADVGVPELLLDQVRRDLGSKTVAEFLAEWRLPSADS
jgi:hypothetical protein